MSSLFHDTNFWVLISFLIFAFVAFKYGRTSMLAMLDEKIAKIKKELDHAENLRIEAQELLAEYKRKQMDAESEAADIIKQAKARAEDMRKKAEEDMERAAKRRETQLQEKLARIEQNAAQDIQSYTANIAIHAARDILNKKMDAKSDKTLITNTLDRVSKTLN